MPSRVRVRRRGLLGVVAAIALAIGLLVAVSGTAQADDPTCQQYDANGQCTIHIKDPGSSSQPGSTQSSGGGNHNPGPTVCKTEKGNIVPCYDDFFGYFYLNQYGDAEYVKLSQPQPPKSSPLWEGHTTGAIYDFIFVEGCGQCTNGGSGWMQNPPPGMVVPPDPGDVARDILATMTMIQPTFHRSPSETNSYQGRAFTYVNTPTWFWTDPADFHPLSKTATNTGVTVTVTATPTTLTFDAGNGASKSCGGPGTAWTTGYGNDVSPSGCSYTYTNVSAAGPVTSKLSTQWDITWTSNVAGQANGTLDPLVSTTTAAAMDILQIQVVGRN